MAEHDQESKVTINKEDIKNTRDFFKHFNIKLPTYLLSVLDTIDASETITEQHQARMKSMIARAMVDNKDHELLKDELFEEVLPNCEKEWFDAQFQEDFESYATEDDE